MSRRTQIAVVGGLVVLIGYLLFVVLLGGGLTAGELIAAVVWASLSGGLTYVGQSPSIEMHTNERRQVETGPSERRHAWGRGALGR